MFFYEDKYIAKVNDIKFLWVNINNTLTWTTHIEKILPKLRSACFALRSVKPFVYEDLKNDLLCIFSLNYVLWDNLLGSYSIKC